MMPRTKQKGYTSPTSNKDKEESIKSIKSKASPNTTVSEQSVPPQRSLYDDMMLDSDSGIDDIIAGKSGFANAAETLVDISKYGGDFDKKGDDFDEPIPDTIESVQDDKLATSMLSMQSSSIQLMYNDARKMSVNLKALLITNIRTTLFRRIKFLTNEKLGRESSICQMLFQTTGITNPVEQIAKYESIRQLIQRQMNSKRNYCTDQIMAKARGTPISYYFSFFINTHFFCQNY
jgi:hypothetical protein